MRSGRKLKLLGSIIGLIFLAVLGGCSFFQSSSSDAPIVLHPSKPDQYFDLPVGTLIMFGSGCTYTTKAFGYFITDSYLAEIADVKLESKE